MSYLAIMPLLASISALAAANLSGIWELQTMGGDRSVVVEHKGARFAAHRVMWPEFEGERYKLEHLFRGVVQGGVIKGELLVKEPELKDFEVLRPFTGKIERDGLIVLDGMPMKPAAPSTKPAAPPTKLADATPPARDQAPGAPPLEPAPAPDPGTSLFDSIRGGPAGDSLFKVSAPVLLDPAAQRELKAGDADYAAKRYERALAHYEAAGTTGPELLHKKGRCQLELGRADAARELLRKALRLDPKNAQVRADYERARLTPSVQQTTK